MELLLRIDSLVWGPPLLILLVGTGFYLTLRLGLLQIFKLPLAIKYLFSKDEQAAKGDVSSFAVLCTALAATIGTGNIVGVATAIKVGGPGALFWMWIAAFFGMATKYAEGLLAVKYREVDDNGNMSGGPMYYLQNGLNSKFLAKMFALFGIFVACFGIGTFPQVNAITAVVKMTFDIPVIVTAVVLTGLAAMVIVGGIKKISKVSETIVPFMAVFYFVGAMIILVLHADAIPSSIALVIRSAFTSTAASGGFLGATIMMAVQSGIARGVFSNESGLGSAPIAAAAAKTNSCVRQGLISMTGTFVDTILICTMTGLVLIITGEWAGELSGAAMTTAAFSGGLSFVGQFIVTIGLIFFAFTTILGWSYYGERCTEYLFGVKGIKVFKAFYISMIGLGVFLKLEAIWVIADIVNGLMAVPNLIGLVGLSNVVVYETRSYFKKLKSTDGISEKPIDESKSLEVEDERMIG
jgi:AGCS family alanine or glycine:cation symporter